MTALAKSRVARSDVELAWANYRALMLAEVDDPRLLDSAEHQQQIAVARFKYQSLYAEWCEL